MTAWHEQAAPPPGYLAVASLGELSTAELAGRRASLLRALGSAPPGGADGALAAALALAAVIVEQDQRARAYAGHQDTPYRCTCGYRCVGLEAMDSHLEQSPGQARHDQAGGKDPGGTRQTLTAARSASSAHTRSTHA